MIRSSKSAPAFAPGTTKALSDGTWQRLMARYPLGSRAGLLWQGFLALVANGTIAWMIGTGRMTPFELVLLVAIEAVLLIGIAMLQARLVPADARERNPMPMRQRLGTLAFALVWLGGAYGIVLFAMVPSGPEIGRLLDDPVAFIGGSNLRWPLLVTLAGALVDAVQDAMHWRRHGGLFLSTPGFNGAARWLTLFLGGIPFFIPLVGIVVGIKTLGEKIVGTMVARAGSTSRTSVLVMLVGPALMFGAFGAAAWLVDSGVSLWAVGYCSAKFVAELFIVCVPLIASKAHAEDVAAAGAPARGKRAKG
jgi:hypothetical protein